MLYQFAHIDSSKQTAVVPRLTYGISQAITKMVFYLFWWSSEKETSLLFSYKFNSFCVLLASVPFVKTHSNRLQYLWWSVKRFPFMLMSSERNNTAGYLHPNLFQFDCLIRHCENGLFIMTLSAWKYIWNAQSKRMNKYL